MPPLVELAEDSVLIRTFLKRFGKRFGGNHPTIIAGLLRLVKYYRRISILYVSLVRPHQLFRILEGSLLPPTASPARRVKRWIWKNRHYTWQMGYLANAFPTVPREVLHGIVTDLVRDNTMSRSNGWFHTIDSDYDGDVPPKWVNENKRSVSGAIPWHQVMSPMARLKRWIWKHHTSPNPSRYKKFTAGRAARAIGLEDWQVRRLLKDLEGYVIRDGQVATGSTPALEDEWTVNTHHPSYNETLTAGWLDHVAGRPRSPQGRPKWVNESASDKIPPPYHDDITRIKCGGLVWRKSENGSWITHKCLQPGEQGYDPGYSLGATLHVSPNGGNKYTWYINYDGYDGPYGRDIGLRQTMLHCIRRVRILGEARPFDKIPPPSLNRLIGRDLWKHRYGETTSGIAARLNLDQTIVRMVLCRLLGQRRVFRSNRTGRWYLVVSNNDMRDETIPSWIKRA